MSKIQANLSAITQLTAVMSTGCSESVTAPVTSDSLVTAAIIAANEKVAENRDATMNLSRQTLSQVAEGKSALSALLSGDIKFDGSVSVLKSVFVLQKDFDMMFNIVTP